VVVAVLAVTLLELPVLLEELLLAMVAVAVEAVVAVVYQVLALLVQVVQVVPVKPVLFIFTTKEKTNAKFCCNQ
jgi:hypothetical protein